MKNILLVVCLMAGLTTESISQDVYDKLSRKICKCLKKEKVVSLEKDTKCLEPLMFTHIDDILAHYKLESIRELDSEKVGTTLIARMSKSCDYVVKMYTKPEDLNNPVFTPDAEPECASIHTGDFYYVQLNQQTRKYDTTFVTITESEYLERMRKGKTYSRLSINWDSECRFTLSFIEKNDPFKSGLSKPGDKYEYEVLKVDDHSFIAQLIWDSVDFFMELKRVE